MIGAVSAKEFCDVLKLPCRPEGENRSWKSVSDLCRQYSTESQRLRPSTCRSFVPLQAPYRGHPCRYSTTDLHRTVGVLLSFYWWIWLRSWGACDQVVVQFCPTSGSFVVRLVYLQPLQNNSTRSGTCACTPAIMDVRVAFMHGSLSHLL